MANNFAVKLNAADITVSVKGETGITKQTLTVDELEKLAMDFHRYVLKFRMNMAAYGNGRGTHEA